MLMVYYDWRLVAASVLVAMLAGFTGLRLASGLAAMPASARKPQIAKAAVALGGGIWSMHFIGMLAVRITVAIEYDALATLGSVLVAVLITGIALGLLHFGERTSVHIVYAGAVMGLGIVSMHYIGMSAIRGNCIVSYKPIGVLLSASVGVAASTGALWLAYKTRSLRDIALGGAALGLSISAMHYTAMIYTRFDPAVEVFAVPDPILSSGALALLVALSSFLFCGFFLLTALPLELVGKARAEADDDGGTGPLDRLPYESNNVTRFLTLDDVRAIKAEGHYTRLYDGSGEFFCPLSISNIESRLNHPDFMRTHRSHLVNISHVSGIRRIGDKATCLLDDETGLQVPVSRSRVQDVRKALGFAN